jgi:hypothetical protein
MELLVGWDWPVEVFLSVVGAPGLVSGCTRKTGELFEPNMTFVLRKLTSVRVSLEANVRRLCLLKQERLEASWSLTSLVLCLLACRREVLLDHLLVRLRPPVEERQIRCRLPHINLHRFS